MKVIILFFIICLSAIVRGQFSNFGHFGGFALDSSLTSVRDPRQNPGPVVFPPSPPDNGETSGVVVGASGFGFVPPSSQSPSLKLA
ncbi:uncharacterized protein LOC123315816 isoform X2 [Coccinella septempunctata]|uniref:uncharacterized protein LOC123315816 isoform X2 n=1 Tax=Coccinella septempunctata TaxID=41139 RepID=UPI001D07FF06|nr:uncharacterized protein LOC123315816 isoform X2 [Coccinella septempunctata]